MIPVPPNDPVVPAERGAHFTGWIHLPAAESSGRHPTRVTRRGLLFAAVLLLSAYLGLTAIWAGLGLLVTGPLADSWMGTVDQDVAGWLAAHRTPMLDDWSRLGTMPADTRVKIIATVIIAAVMLIGWRSWREPFLICFALILEAAVFITVTGIVGRPRPAVAQLDQVSVDTSFPSGHAAAAAAYCAIAIVIFERTRNRWLRATAVLVAVGLPVLVGICRMYRGVHYLTDVIAGITLGMACVVAVYVIVRRCFQRPGSERHRSAPGQAPRPDPR
jgi:undecaprenyl-diphosphatase